MKQFPRRMLESEIVAELLKVQSEIDRGYWNFSRCARGKLATFPTYRRRTILKAQLVSHRARKRWKDAWEAARVWNGVMAPDTDADCEKVRKAPGFERALKVFENRETAAGKEEARLEKLYGIKRKSVRGRRLSDIKPQTKNEETWHG